MTEYANAMQGTGYFEESPGNKSFTRLMGAWSFVTSVGFGVLAVLLQSEYALYLSILGMLGCFAPKAVQKFAEQNKLGKG